jgi:N-acetylneuraminic acid mutarotase
MRLQEIYPAELDGQVFVVGGLSPDAGAEGIAATDRVFAWHPDSPDWEEHTPQPFASHHANCVGVEGHVFAIGGFTPSPAGAWAITQVVTIYDPIARIWEMGPELPQPQAEAVAGVLGGRVHLAAGRGNSGGANGDYNDHHDIADHLVLDPASGRWETAAPVPSPRNSAAGAVLGGRLHIVGGRTMAGGNIPDHDVYLPDEDRWASLAPLPQPAAGPRGAGGLAMAALGGRLYVFGGEWFSDGGGVYYQVWSWSPEADSWEEMAPMPLPRHGLGAVSMVDRIATVGGAAQAGARATTAAVQIFAPPLPV